MAPAWYHNEMMGELLASWFQHAIARNVADAAD